MPAIVADMIDIMDSLAPLKLKEEWDNSGLQVGKKDWPVKKIWLALDPTADVITAACKNASCKGRSRTCYGC